MYIVSEMRPLTSAVLEAMNQFTSRHSVDTMARLSNGDMADMHRVFEQIGT